MSNLLKSSIVVLILSGISFFWGRSYVDAHPMSQVASMFGVSNSNYSAAQSAVVLGALGFFIGLVLLIVALVKEKSPDSGVRFTSNVTTRVIPATRQPEQVRSETGQYALHSFGTSPDLLDTKKQMPRTASTAKFCSSCGASVLGTGSAFCSECGTKLPTAADPSPVVARKIGVSPLTTIASIDSVDVLYDAARLIDFYSSIGYGVTEQEDPSNLENPIKWTMTSPTGGKDFAYSIRQFNELARIRAKQAGVSLDGK